MAMKILYPPNNPHINNIRKKLTQHNNNQKFQRQTKYKNTILENQQDALLYYGPDYTGDTDYNYQPELEQENQKIINQINDYLAWAYKHLTTDTLDL